MSVPLKTRTMNPADPHADSPVLTRGPAPEEARATLVMIHGRGASAASILSLHDALGRDDVAAVAPQATAGTWYPLSFLAPLASNQPWLDSALARVEATVADLIARGVPPARIGLLGFSQGACLVSESIARRPRRYGAAMILTGGIIGPPGSPPREVAAGSLDGTPIFLGASDPDPHVPAARVRETATLFERMGGRVDLRLYPGLPHTVNDDMIDACRTLVDAMRA